MKHFIKCELAQILNFITDYHVITS